MPTLEISDDDAARIDRLREELEASHAGPYATVETAHVIEYLLDLADAVDDPERSADSEAVATTADDGSTNRESFPRDRLRERLEERNLRHADPDEESEMDLYTIAAEYDVAGRSEMTKAELIDAIIDAVERLYSDPLSPTDLELDAFGATSVEPEDERNTNEPEPTPDDIDDNATVESAEEAGKDATAESDDDATAESDDDATAESDDDATAKSDDDAETESDDGDGQLNAMLSLLETHDDKWQKSDGDARYEVELPDGSVETARTKDDVRALLFKNY